MGTTTPYGRASFQKYADVLFRVEIGESLMSSPHGAGAKLRVHGDRVDEEAGVEGLDRDVTASICEPSGTKDERSTPEVVSDSITEPLHVLVMY